MPLDPSIFNQIQAPDYAGAFGRGMQLGESIQDRPNRLADLAAQRELRQQQVTQGRQEIELYPQAQAAAAEKAQFDRHTRHASIIKEVMTPLVTGDSSPQALIAAYNTAKQYGVPEDVLNAQFADFGNLQDPEQIKKIASGHAMTIDQWMKQNAPEKPEKPEKPVQWTTQTTDKGLIQVNPITGETRPLGYGAPKKEPNPFVEAKMEQVKIDKENARTQQSLSAQQVLDQSEILFSHPGRKMATGASSFMSNIPGTEAKGFQANLNTFKAQTFVPMVSALKGMGALSDAEGKKLSESVGALDPSMPEAEFENSLKSITKYLYDKAKAAGLNVSLPSFASDKSKVHSEADRILGL